MGRGKKKQRFACTTALKKSVDHETFSPFLSFLFLIHVCFPFFGGFIFFSLLPFKAYKLCGMPKNRQRLKRRAKTKDYRIY